MGTHSDIIDRWLEALGYDGSVGVVHRSAADVRADHPYAREIDLMLRADGEIGSTAVFDVDRVPTVCFIEPTRQQALDPRFVSEVRRKIWNQNLVSIVVIVHGDRADVHPAPRSLDAKESLSLGDAKPNGHFSAAEVASGSVYARLPEWFDRNRRVDRVLLENLSATVDRLRTLNLTQEQAQLLVGKCIFVSYLEDRGIVADTYRDRRQVGNLLELLLAADGSGLDRLFRQLKSDFNGNFLEIENGANVNWRSLDAQVFDLLASFLQQTHISTGQRSLWRYDFKYIPVELISGIYESFLGTVQRDQGAVYTPRHLATLAVDEAFRDIDQPWKEVVLDGACGSGILLTCAYRRMLGAARVKRRRALTYQERSDILLSGIRGGDVSPAACKVTAFSLYLALLEDLAPSDIALLQDDHDVKLPELIGDVITPDNKGDFFSPRNPVAQAASATIVISNPPWYEPKDDAKRPYEDWWRKRFGETLPRRQIALAFARRATDALKPGGRLCLIMPAATLGAEDAGSYLKSWFRDLRPQRIFNLADMRFVLFEGAIHPTAVISGVKRQPSEQGGIPPREMCDYLVPKADVSLAFGRLTVHGSDRKRLHVNALCQDSEALRTYFWGNELDEALIARLRLIGTLRHHAIGNDARFVICKGFHLTDRSKEPISSAPLRKSPFLKTAIGASRYPKDRLFIADKDLEPFPASIQKVADLGSKDGQAFYGERVLFPDGADTTTLEVRACYTNRPICFTQTVGAIVDRQSDPKLMQFLAAYLRSKLARYLLFYTTFSLTMERPHVKLTEIAELPFLLPEEHPEPRTARKAIDDVCALLKPYRRGAEVGNDQAWINVRHQVDKLVFDYFGLSATERKVVNETCEYFIPSRQPTNFRALRSPLQGGPTKDVVESYARILRQELESWRERLSGSGHFQVALLRSSSKAVGAPAIVRIGVQDHPGALEVVSADGNVVRLLEELRGKGIYPHAGNETLSVASDFLVHHAGDLYLIKPWIKRLWLAGTAAHDAYRIVQAVRGEGAVH